METYAGELNVLDNIAGNVAAIQGLVNYVKDHVDYSNCGSQTEKEELKILVGMALQNVLPSNVCTNVLKLDDFKIECLIGYGSFGKIWKASFNDKEVALKQLSVNINDLRRIWKERDMMIVLKNVRICNLIAAFYDRDIFYVLELCHGSLASLKYRISPKHAVRFSLQLLEGIVFIHSKNIVHADIKPDNCLINTSNNLVISDFGSALRVKEEHDAIQLSVSHGSAGFLDLKANKFLKFSKSTDVFSTACVIFELDTKAHLLMYAGQEQTRELYVDALENGRINGLQHNSPNEFMQREFISDRVLHSRFGLLLGKMITEEHRLTAMEALNDPALVLVLRESAVRQDFIDNDPEFITKEFNLDYRYSFGTFANGPTPELELALLTFEYKEKMKPENTMTQLDRPIRIIRSAQPQYQSVFP